MLGVYKSLLTWKTHTFKFDVWAAFATPLSIGSLGGGVPFNHALINYRYCKWEIGLPLKEERKNCRHELFVKGRLRGLKDNWFKLNWKYIWCATRRNTWIGCSCLFVDLCLLPGAIGNCFCWIQRGHSAFREWISSSDWRSSRAYQPIYRTINFHSNTITRRKKVLKILSALSWHVFLMGVVYSAKE